MPRREKKCGCPKWGPGVPLGELNSEPLQMARESMLPRHIRGREARLQCWRGRLGRSCGTLLPRIRDPIMDLWLLQETGITAWFLLEARRDLYGPMMGRTGRSCGNSIPAAGLAVGRRS